MAYLPQYTTPKQILLNPENSCAQPATLKDDNAVADSNGQKWVKAGTPVGSADSFLLNPQVVLSPAKDGTVQGVVLHDTNLNNPYSAVVLKGVINIATLDDDVQALYTADVIAALQSKNILVLKR